MKFTESEKMFYKQLREAGYTKEDALAALAYEKKQRRLEEEQIWLLTK
jgi:hypothetical protein